MVQIEILKFQTVFIEVLKQLLQPVYEMTLQFIEFALLIGILPFNLWGKNIVIKDSNVNHCLMKAKLLGAHGITFYA